MNEKIKNWSMTGCKGRFYVRGKKNIIWYQDGRSYRISTNLEYSRANRQLAADKIRQMEMPGVVSEARTIFSAFREFIELSKQSKTENTIRNYLISFKRLISQDFRLEYYLDIRQMIENNVQMNDANLSKKSLNLYLKNMRAFFNYLVEKEYMFKNPVLKSMYFKIPEKSIEIYTEEELHKIFNYLKYERKKHHYYEYFKIIYYCALRRSELLNMKWDHVKDRNRFRPEIIIPKSKFGNRVDYFPITDELREYFEEIPQNTEYVFNINGNMFNNALNKALIAMEIDKHTEIANGNGRAIHTFRKTRISEWLYKQNLELQIVSQLSRDSIATLMKYYAKMERKKLRDYL